ncbi:MAG: CBS domain-containing protein [Deltaproteobacteria bacterium]|nr:CBS domain-containing protein [Deltaproteobacteria bacterium]
MRCEEIMKTNVECLKQEDNVQLASQRMRDANVGFLPVCDANRKVIGTLTDRDIVLRCCTGDRLPSAVKVSEAMTREVISCRPQDDIHKAEELMAKHHKSRIIVTDDQGIIQGVISLSDIAQREDPKQTGQTMRQVSSREARTY